MNQIDKSTRPAVQRRDRKSMHSSVIRLGGIGLGCLAAAAFLGYVESNLLLGAGWNNDKPDCVTGTSFSDCALWFHSGEVPLPNDNDFPDTSTDLDEADDAAPDLNADDSRNHQNTPFLFAVELDDITMQLPEIIRARRICTPGSYYLHDHMRERAPPLV